VGPGAANSYQMFEYSALSMMTGEPNTRISVDANADGDYLDANDVNNVLLVAEGSNRYVFPVAVGARVVSDKPVQVDFLTGDDGSNYESRDSALLPTSMWASDYFTPVSTTNVTSNAGDERTTVWLYNRQASSLTVTYQYRDAAGALQTSNLTVPANGVLKQIIDPATTGTQGARFYSAGTTFYAFSTTDSASTDTARNQAWDWGYTMIPRTMLTTQALVGLGIGRDPTSLTNPNENGNPVWVSPVGNGSTPTDVYVDYDGDPLTGRFTDPSGNGFDARYTLRELDHALVYVPPTTATGVVVDATSSATTGDPNSVASLTFAHTTGVADNRLLLVGVVVGNEAGGVQTVDNVTYRGLPLTRIGFADAPTGGAGDPDQLPRVELWGLARPPAGQADVVVTLTGARAFVAGAMTFSGVDVGNGLTSALGTFASAFANSGTTQSVNVATTAGDMVFDVVGAGIRGTAFPAEFFEQAGQTERWQQTARRQTAGNDRYLRGAGSTELATGGTTTMSWTSTTSYPWAIGAVPIKPMPAGTKTDQTGILVYTLSTSVKLAVAWGQDPYTASASAPGLDVGTSVPPMPEFQAAKDGELYTDSDGDGYLSPGDVMEYPIAVYNVSRLPVPNVYVWDHAPDPTLYDTTYVTGSTYLHKDNNGDGDCTDPGESVTQIPDDGSGTAFPLDAVGGGGTPDGYNIGTLPVGAIYTVTFHVTLDTYENLITGTEAIYNGGRATALGWPDPVDDDAFLKGRISDFVWLDADEDGVQDTGETGVAGITVRLLDGAGNQLYDTSGDPITYLTLANGFYEFTGLPAGTYIVDFEIPTGSAFEFTTADTGSDDSVDSDANATTGRTGVLTLNGGQRVIIVDAGVTDPTPTLAVIGSLNAYKSGGKVVVAWDTTSEAGTAGFYLERSVGKTDRWVAVNREIVPALFESPSGGSYTLVDAEAKVGTSLTYRLVELETSGEMRLHGPYVVKASASLPSGQASSEITQGKQSARVPKIAKAREQQGMAGAKRGVGKEKASSNRLRIEVVDPGLYVISASEIATGLNLTTEKAAELIAAGRVTLTSQGKGVAYLPAQDGSSLYFYGQAIDSIYTTTNVYWLTQGKGKTMIVPETAALGTDSAETTTTTPVPAETTTSATLPAPTTSTAAVPAETTTSASVPAETTTSASVPAETTTSDLPPAETTTSATDSAGTTTSEAAPTEAAAAETTTTSEVVVIPEAITSFVDTLHVEQDLFGAPAIFHDPEADFWLWMYMVAGNASLQKATVTLDTPYALGVAKLSVQLHGLNTREITNEHLVEVRLNGTVLGQTAWSGQVAHAGTFDVPAGVLVAGQNTVELTALRNTGVTVSLVAVDSLDLTYERATVAVNDRMVFTSPASGLVRVDGLGSASAWVFDASASFEPRVLPIVGSGGEAGAVWLSFDGVQGARYLVSTSTAALHPLALTATTGTTLRTQRSADYLIITTSGLVNAANSLAQYRASQGLKTTVVTMSEIYDEFNHGIANPHAIQSFLKHARSSWKPGPKYVVLAGEGSYDYKNYLKFADCLVPSLLVDTEFGLASSDVLLADVVGSNGVPEMAVGRILALNESELTAAIEKIKGYEAAAGAWNTAVLLVADNSDDGGDFTADSDRLSTLLPSSLTVSMAYLDRMAPADVRAAILSGFTSGSLWLNYIGHAGVDQLASERLLARADAQNLSATGSALPVVSALSCVAGSYNLPGYSGMGELLVKRPSAGAIAMWAPSAMELNEDSVLFGSFFAQKVFGSSKNLTLGQGILAAQKAAAGAEVPVLVIRTYNLLGDPALRIR
jgi:hypothetical protein